VSFDPTLLLMGGLLVVLVIFMIRNNRKRKREAETLQNSVRPGAEVMTNFGVYGKIVSIDDAENKIVLETSPKHYLTVHRQVVSRVVTPSGAPAETMSEAIESGVADLALNPEKESGKLTIDPQYGERVSPKKPAVKKTAAAAKPAAKKPASSAKPAAKKPASK